MSAALVRQALEAALATVSPALQTVYENDSRTPPSPGTAYQSVFILFAEPDNRSLGPIYQEVGFMQVNLMYPEGAGPGAAAARAGLIRSTFHRGASFTAGGVVVVIQRTPEIMPARNEGGRYVQPVRIRFFANVEV